MSDLDKDNDTGNLLTIAEVATMLRLHPNTIRRWSSKGILRAYRIGPRGDRRFKREEIERHLMTDSDVENLQPT
jgi:excisionase family DNA binding protein